MTDTPPPSAILGQQAPRDSSWPAQHIEPYRSQLLARLDDITRRRDEIDQQHGEAVAKTDKDVDALEAKIPDVGDNPTEAEWLTRRAAQVESDLAYTRGEAVAQELWLKRQRLYLEACEVQLRIGQVDHLLEDGLYAAGGDSQLAILMLDAQEVAVAVAHEANCMEIARQRLDLTKRMHREINTALRAAKRAEERSRKQS